MTRKSQKKQKKTERTLGSVHGNTNEVVLLNFNCDAGHKIKCKPMPFPRLFLLFLFISQFSFAQFSYQPVLPGIIGEALVRELKVQYRPPFTLDYSVARDTLFSRIDGIQDSLSCIYTGMKLFMKPGQDPTEAVYLGGIPNGINTEHSWPQGKGAIGQAQSDMHHLFPSRIKTNADRGDFPFGDIPDGDTKIWYLKSSERTTPPSSNRDQYSEYVPGKFEPRESVKGNIARAIFYFYTMYKELADAADSSYFAKMQAVLCDWHYQDPVDEQEWLRSKKIARYQGGKENPFVLDCSLVSRAFCNNIDQACEAIVASDSDLRDSDGPSFALYPNPGCGQLTIQTTGMEGAKLDIRMMDLSGNILFEKRDVQADQVGRAVIEAGHLPHACYLVQITCLNMLRPIYRLYIRQ